MPRPSLPRRWIPALLVVAAALLAWTPALDGSFVYDDHYYVLGNPAVRGEASPWTSPLGDAWQGLWRPVTVASLAAQWSDPARPGAFHTVDVLLHVLVSLLVLVLGRRLGLGAIGSALAALLFAVHPVHAEAVAWVSQRAELLAAAFVLAGWIAHRGRGPASALVAGVCVLLAGLSKENALVAPGLYVLGDLALGDPERRDLRTALTRALPAAGAVLLVLGLRMAVLEHVTPGHGPFRETDLAGRCVVALAVLGRAVRLLAWPHPLRVEYQKDEVALAGLPDLLAIAALGLIAGLVRRRVPTLTAGLLLVPLALLPVLHLLPIGEPFAERFLYLPSVPFCLGIGAALGAWADHEARRPRGRGVSLLAAGALLVAGVLAARPSGARFQDDLTLWRHAARVAPHVALARYNLGLFLLERDRLHPQARDRPGALDELAVSLRLGPGHAWAGWAHLALARAALDTDPPTPPRPGTAARHLRQALERDARLVDARLLFAELALSNPEVVGRSEALAALDEVAALGLDAGPRADAARLRARLLAPQPPASPSEASTGTSSDEGS